jgi:hypothetical protein
MIPAYPFPFLFVFGSVVVVVGTVRLHRPQKGNVANEQNARVSR